ncbi:MAG: hypothetical protein KDI63_02695 [Gammaproteobacteria bacterium]|nr:hypothetical protein [Gammaproteobacteria bacterium]
MNDFKSIKRMLRIFTTLTLMGAVSLAWGGDDRYRAIVLHEGGASADTAALAPKVFILDAQEGHMWIWEQNARIKQQDGGQIFGNVLIYQGRLKVGGQMGDVVSQSR